jgi:arylsulfatase A
MKIHRHFLPNALIVGSLILVSGMLTAASAPAKPNIILILADDAGIGDYEPYNTLFETPDSVALVTPNVRRLADEGLTFTRAHSTGSVCQPSRFSIITGLFPIRKAIGTRSSIENRLIEADRPTLPNFLRQQGYRTAIVGKWHLDYMLPTKNKAPARANNIDPSQPLPLGAEDYGFDYGFWLIKGHGSAFIENRRIVKLTTQKDYSSVWPDRPAWNGHARWQTAPFGSDEKITEPERSVVADAITDKALDFLETAARDRVPFFLYLPVISPHAPHIPAKDINGQPLIDGAKIATALLPTTTARSAFTKTTSSSARSWNNSNASSSPRTPSSSSPPTTEPAPPARKRTAAPVPTAATKALPGTAATSNPSSSNGRATSAPARQATP